MDITNAMAHKASYTICWTLIKGDFTDISYFCLTGKHNSTGALIGQISCVVLSRSQIR